MLHAWQVTEHYRRTITVVSLTLRTIVFSYPSCIVQRKTMTKNDIHCKTHIHIRTSNMYALYHLSMVFYSFFNSTTKLVFKNTYLSSQFIHSHAGTELHWLRILILIKYIFIYAQHWKGILKETEKFTCATEQCKIFKKRISDISLQYSAKSLMNSCILKVLYKDLRIIQYELKHAAI